MTESTLDPKTLALAAPPAEAVLDPTVYERIMLAASFLEPDRVPIWDFIDSWPIYQRFAPGETDPTMATAKVFNSLEIDLCRSIYLPRPPDSDGEAGANESTGWKTSGKTVWVTHYPLKSLEDIRSYDPGLPTEEQVWNEVAWYLGVREAFAPTTLYVPGGGMGFHGTYGLMGLQVFSMALYDAHDEVERIINRMNEGAVLRARAYSEAQLCPFYFIGDDIAYKDRTMFSHAVMDELFFPQLARVCEPLNNADIKVIFHTDGYVMGIMDKLIEAGVSGINPIEPLAGNDIAEMKRRWGRNCIMVGGVDCSQLLPLGSVEDVREGTKAVIRAAGHGGGLFIGSSSEIVPVTPEENILAFYETCHEFGRYPLKG
jgi:hypothetical protein